MIRIILMAGFILLLAGCSQLIPPNSPDGTVISPSATAQVTETQAKTLSPTQGENPQMNPSLPIPSLPTLQKLIEKAKEDLAGRLSLSVTQVNLVETAEVVWPDASLGCPQKGMEYAQVLTPGYLIRLESGGNTFEYHAGRGPDVIYCTNPTPPYPGVPDNT